MRYRAIAAGTLQISCIGVGGNIFGYVCDNRQTSQILATAYDLGINWVDTADVYSDGRSEEYIGSAIQGNRTRWIIATKAGVASNANPFGFARAENLRRKIEGSLMRLKTDYIDLYQMHHFDQGTTLEETLETLELFRREGKVRFFGASNYSGEAVQASIAAAAKAGLTPFSSLQCHYNLFCRSAESHLFHVCRTRNVAILAYGVLARGVLTGKYAQGRPPPTGSRAALSKNVCDDLSADIFDSMARISDLSKPLGIHPGQMAMAWVLRHTEVASAVVGVRDEAQLKEMVDATEIDLSQNQMEHLEAIANRVSRHTETAFGAPTIFG